MKLKVGSKIYTDSLEGEMVHLSPAKNVIHIKWDGSNCLQKIRLTELNRCLKSKVWSIKK